MHSGLVYGRSSYTEQELDKPGPEVKPNCESRESRGCPVTYHCGPMEGMASSIGRARRKEKSQHRKDLIVSAGTLGSTTILLRSHERER